jgi:hypothetical protein
MTSAQLGQSLHIQEEALRDLALRIGPGSSASRTEFMAWANEMPQKANIELLSAELETRASPIRRRLASKILSLIVLSGFVVLVTWLKTSG